jgi:hypothetical protein
MCWTCMHELAVSLHWLQGLFVGPWRETSFTLRTMRRKRHSTCPTSHFCEIGGACLGAVAGTTPPVELE